MGTSSAYGGPGGGTPLIPTWLEPEDGEAPQATPVPRCGRAAPPSGQPESPPARPPIPIPTDSRRFAAARSNYSRFASSGGRDRSHLGRAVSHYVTRASGGSRQAARRMGSSRAAGGRLLGFLADAATRGVRDALRALNLERLAGRPIEEIFLGLADYVCPEGGSIDEGIAREAFVETIADLAENGIADLDALTAEEMQTVFEALRDTRDRGTSLQRHRYAKRDLTERRT